MVVLAHYHERRTEMIRVYPEDACLLPPGTLGKALHVSQYAVWFRLTDAYEIAQEMRRHPDVHRIRMTQSGTMIPCYIGLDPVSCKHYYVDGDMCPCGAKRRQFRVRFRSHDDEGPLLTSFHFVLWLDFDPETHITRIMACDRTKFPESDGVEVFQSGDLLASNLYFYTLPGLTEDEVMEKLSPTR